MRARYVMVQHNGQESPTEAAQLAGVLLKLTLTNKGLWMKRENAYHICNTMGD